LPIISARRDECLPADVPAALRQDLVLEVRRRDPGIHEQLGLALDVEDVPIARVHVDDDRRDVEVPWRDALLGSPTAAVSWYLRSAETVRRAPSAISGPL
jgi:hypothetical protein